MKKILLTLLALSSISAFAQVGYVDYDYIYKNLPISQQYQKKINAKAKEVRDYNLETKKMSENKTYDEKLQINASRKEALYKVEREYIDLRYKQEEVVKAKVQEASNTVLKAKELDMIIDKKSRVAGGVDCTQEIFKAIK